MNKGRKAPKTPVKPVVSPWWGNDNRINAISAPSNMPSSALDLSSLPKLGQQTPGAKPRAQTPQPGTSQAPPYIPGDISALGPIAAPNLGSAGVPNVPPTGGPASRPPPTSAGPLLAAPPNGRDALQHILNGNQQLGAKSQIQLHLPYLDGPSSKPSTLLNSSSSSSSAGATANAAPAKPPVAESDRFGLKPLLRVLTADSAGTFSPAVGTEIAPVPETDQQLSRSFASPWAETSKHCIIPEYTLPSCYNVQSVVPQQQKLQNLTEETLFYIFYTMPRDAMQEAVAVELTNRNWRYHKDLKLWLTKDPMSEPVQQNAQAESGVYVFFDPSTWEKVKKEYILYYPDIA